MLRTPADASIWLSVVVPVYRSEDCLPDLIREIEEALAPGGRRFEVILVNDFSPDGSWATIKLLCEEYAFAVGIDLRRNFGQDNAILTGIRQSRGRFVAVMDDDLQHDPKYLPALVMEAESGPDVVYADFATKHQEAWKNVGSWLNGKIAEWVLYKPRNLYFSPYKVIRREVAEEICRYNGPVPYIDGLLFQATWRMASIPVEHRPRKCGRGNYGFWRSVGLTGRLIFAFSVRPVRAVAWIGLLTSVLALAAGAFVIGYRLFFPQDFPREAAGWASIMVAILLMGGLQMCFFGVLGEYVGRTYLRVNDKPQTSIREILNGSVGDASPALPKETGSVRNPYL
jgi:undecaprenyl-phosphate 4-deoxy-4-formamido-L-arabinose transferase